MKLTPFEGELQKSFVACYWSDLTPAVATRSATVDMAVKWRLNPKERTEFACAGSLCTAGLTTRQTKAVADAGKIGEGGAKTE
jgi:hypothetical protein